MNARVTSVLKLADLPLVLALARAHTLAAAAELLDVDTSTVFRRLNLLERRMRVRLFDRAARGYRLTGAGEHAAAAAERIETELHTLDRDITGRDRELTGALRITASETLCYAILPPLLSKFRASHPGIQLTLTIDNRLLDLARREADVALRTRRPAEADLFGRRLAGIAWAFYTSMQGPLRTLKRSDNRFDFTGRPVIGWEDPSARIVASGWLEAQVPAAQIVYRSNSLVNHFAAVRAGVGLALLPCYLADPLADIQRVTAPVQELEGELWIVTHKDLKETARVRAFLSVVGDGIAAQRPLFEGVQPIRHRPQTRPNQRAKRR